MLSVWLTWAEGAVFGFKGFSIQAQVHPWPSTSTSGGILALILTPPLIF